MDRGIKSLYKKKNHMFDFFIIFMLSLLPWFFITAGRGENAVILSMKILDFIIFNIIFECCNKNTDSKFSYVQFSSLFSCSHLLPWFSNFLNKNNHALNVSMYFHFVNNTWNHGLIVTMKILIFMKYTRAWKGGERGEGKLFYKSI